MASKTRCQTRFSIFRICCVSVSEGMLPPWGAVVFATLISDGLFSRAEKAEEPFFCEKVDPGHRHGFSATVFASLLQKKSSPAPSRKCRDGFSIKWFRDLMKCDSVAFGPSSSAAAAAGCRLNPWLPELDVESVAGST